MTLDEFWNHIHATRRKEPRAHADALAKRLAHLAEADIFAFDHWWWALKSEAETWHLWGAAYLIGGGCSDDGFLDFRSWLLLQGRDTFQAAVSDPDTLADVVPAGDDRCRCECYPALGAWFDATGTPRDRAGYDAFSAAARRHRGPRYRASDMGERWNFDDDEETRRRLPRLAARFLSEGDA